MYLLIELSFARNSNYPSLTATTNHHLLAAAVANISGSVTPSASTSPPMLTANLSHTAPYTTANNTSSNSSGSSSYPTSTQATTQATNTLNSNSNNNNNNSNSTSMAPLAQQYDYYNAGSYLAPYPHHHQHLMGHQGVPGQSHYSRHLQAADYMQAQSDMWAQKFHGF